MSLFARFIAWLTVPLAQTTPSNIVFFHRGSDMSVAHLTVTATAPQPGGKRFAFVYSIDAAPQVVVDLLATPTTTIPAPVDGSLTYHVEFTDAAGVAWLPSVETTFKVPGVTPANSVVIAVASVDQ
jgi:hypothetical protein